MDPLTLRVSDDAARPLFVRVADAVVDEVRRGRLRPGARLPGSRALAASLGVHRNTVVAAYAELCSQGWLTTRPGGGTYVDGALPDAGDPDRVGARADAMGFDLPEAPVALSDPLAPARYQFASTPDPRDAPWSELARAYRRVLRVDARGLLGYTDPRGDARLRVQVADMLAAHRAMAVTADDIQLTRGSQMGLYLVARALLRPGDKVAVEALGYAPAWAALRAAGAELVPIPVDAEGLRVDLLGEIEDLRAAYVTPHHQYPTTVTLGAARRIALLRVCRERRVALIEDDYDNEFHFDGPPRLPMAADDTAGCVVYVGTLSKVLAPGLRIGFVVGRGEINERLSRLRRVVDRQGDTLGERAVAELFADGEVRRHVLRMRRMYRRRRDRFVGLLRQRLPWLEFAVPAGGMALWVHADVDFETWARRALEAGVAFPSGDRFTFEGGSVRGARLGFATLDEPRLDAAVRVLVETAPR